MNFKRIILLTLIHILLILAVSPHVQSQEIKNADDILEQLENGEDVNYENIQIIGIFNIDKIDLPKGYGDRLIVESEIIIKNSTFNNVIDFSNTIFTKNIYFKGTNFSSGINSNNSIYNGNVTFDYTNFNDKVSINRVNFSNNISFNSANFSNDAFFHNTKLHNADFRLATFHNNAEFSHAEFFNVTNFNDVNFFGNANFNFLTTYGDTFFNSVEFHDIASFRKVKFFGNVNFEDTIFSKKAYFNNGNFRKYADFSRAKFEDDVFLPNSTFTSVNLNDTEFERMEIYWSSIKNALIYNSLTYSKLINNFREQTLYDDADKAYYEFHQQRDKNLKGFSWFFSALMKFSCGYGVKPKFPLYWGIFLIGFFGILYWKIFDITFSDALECSAFSFISSYNNNFVESVDFEENRNLYQTLSIYYAKFKLFRIYTPFYNIFPNKYVDISKNKILIKIEKTFQPFTSEKLFISFIFSELFLGWIIFGLFLVTLANVMIRP